MEYAAVIIPTLNRINHLKRCVNSLKANREAVFTDLYISVDYPPSEKYRIGYSDVKEYVGTIDGFNSVNIYYQERNLGPGLNRKFLEEKMGKDHDKYIFTDDDNEFSTNFLAYINWGLEKYKDDDSVYAVCSTTDFSVVGVEDSIDYLMIPAYTPYGTGHWLHKNKVCEAFLSQANISQIYKSKERQKRILDVSPMVYMWIADDSVRAVPAMRGKNDQMTYIDIWENVYCIDTGKVCVLPTKPKSRNWGLDGSGVHVGEGDVKDYVPLDILDENGLWFDNPARASEQIEGDNLASHSDNFSISKKDANRCRMIFNMNRILGNKVFCKTYKTIRSVYRFCLGKKESKESIIKYG